MLSHIFKLKNIYIHGVEAAKRGPSAYYKIFQEGASKLMVAIKNVRVIKNSGHCYSMMDRLISSAWRYRSC